MKSFAKSFKDLIVWQKSQLEESRYYLILANDLKYIETQELVLQLEEVSKILYSYTSKVQASHL